MFLTIILLALALLLVLFIVFVASIGGTILTIIFSDVIVCIFIICLIIRFLIKRRR